MAGRRSGPGVMKVKELSLSLTGHNAPHLGSKVELALVVEVVGEPVSGHESRTAGLVPCLL